MTDITAAVERLRNNTEWTASSLTEQEIADIRQLIAAVPQWRERPTEPGWYACLPGPEMECSWFMYLSKEHIEIGAPFNVKMVCGPWMLPPPPQPNTPLPAEQESE